MSAASQTIKSSPPSVATDLVFDGSDAETLNRLVYLTKLEHALAPQSTDSQKSAWLAQRFVGPALDWVGSEISDDIKFLNDFEELVEQARLTFGHTDESQKARWQVQLDSLKWGRDVPMFFAEFERLTRNLKIEGKETRLQILRSKLPTHILADRAAQSKLFDDYLKVKSDLLLRHALLPNGPAEQSAKRAAKPKCGNCGKKGHAAADCRSKN